MKSRCQEFNLKEYMENIVKTDLDRFDIYVRWTEKDKEQFRMLLNDLEAPYGNESETSREKGNRLEKLVEFIIRKSYFYEVYKNVRTETNEIDEVIVFSERGKQALEHFHLSRKLIPIDEDLFLGECKNYASKLGVTYVGKFYGLMTGADISFGIIFTQNGLTGSSEGYKDAYGLTKLLRMVEKSSNKKELFILTFTLEDYKKLLDGVTFFELVEAKKLEMQLASNYNNFIKDNQHENSEEIKRIVAEI